MDIFLRRQTDPLVYFGKTPSASLRRAGSAAPHTVGTNTDASRRSDRGHIRCLLIESNIFILMDLEQIVQSMGISYIDHAQDIEQAKRLIERDTYDFVVLDYDFEMDGIGPFVQRVQHQNMPLIVIAFSVDVADDCPALLGSPIITKPFLTVTVENTLRKLLGRKIA